jgi:beta-lactamase regulating signal transducer with metallopeptidase domain
MSNISSLIEGPVVQSLGWSLVHFLWQGVLIGVVTSAALAVTRRRTAAARYDICVASMFLMMLAPLLTFLYLLQDATRPLPAVPPELLLLIEPATPWSQWMEAWLPHIALIWLGGVFIFQARLLVLWRRSVRLRQHGATLAPTTWRETTASLSESLGVRRAVRVLQSTVAESPMVVGWIRPVVLLPVRVFEELTPPQLRSIIAHELAHLRRYDDVINLIQAVFESLLFYHPMVWWVSHRLRVEREYCCDDVAVQACGNALCYARALALLDTLRIEARQTTLTATGGPLMSRISRIVGKQSISTPRPTGWVMPALLTALISAGAATTFFASQAEAVGPDHKDKVVIEQKKQATRDVDIALIAKKMGHPQADLLYALQEAGVDRATLMAALAQLDDTGKIVQAVKIAEKKQQEKAATARVAWVKAEQEELIKKLKAKEKAIITDLKERGASDEEIKKTLAKFRQEAKMKLAMHEKQSQLIAEMKQAGATEVEIKKAVQKLHASTAEQDAYAKKREQYIKQMMADGASKAEIKKAIMEFDRKVELARMVEVKEKQLVEQMKAGGASKEEITRAVKELHAKAEMVHTERVKISEKQMAEEKQIVAKMREMGISDATIKQVIKEWRAKHAG